MIRQFLCVVRSLSLLGIVVAGVTQALGLNFSVIESRGLLYQPLTLVGSDSVYLVGGEGFASSSSDGEDWTVEVNEPGTRFISAYIDDSGWYLGTEDGRLFSRPAGAESWLVEQVLEYPVLEIERGEGRTVVLYQPDSDSAFGTRVRVDGAGWMPAVETPADFLAYNDFYGLRPPSNSLQFGNGVFVFAPWVADHYYVSPNGTEWAKVVLEATSPLISGLAYHKGTWLAFGVEGHNPLKHNTLTSSDLASWESLPGGLGAPSSVGTYPGGFWAVLGATLSRTADGQSWKSSEIRITSPWVAMAVDPLIAWGPARFLSISRRDLSPWILSSMDGVSWRKLSGIDVRLYGDEAVWCDFAGGHFYREKDGITLTSTDGQTWQTTVVLEQENASLPRWGEFVVMGNSIYCYAMGTVFKSIDGVHWTVVNSGEPKVTNPIPGKFGRLSLNGFVGFKGVLFTVLWDGFGYGIAFSSDGENWTVTKEHRFSNAYLVAADDYLLIISYYETYISRDGVRWDVIDNSGMGNGLRPVAHGSEVFGFTDGGTVYGWNPEDGLRSLVPTTADGERIYPNHGFRASDGTCGVISDGRLYLGQTFTSLTEQNIPFHVQNALVGNGILVAVSQNSAGYAVLDNPWDQGTIRYDSWIVSPWYGWLFDGTFPFVYHAEHGWEYQVVTPDGIYTFDYGLSSWVWKTQGEYPWMYLFEEEGWAYYQTNSVTPGRWFYSVNAGDWVNESDIMDSE